MATFYNRRQGGGALFLTPWYPNHYDPMPGLFVRRHAQLTLQWVPVSVLCVQGVSGHKLPPSGVWSSSGISCELSVYDGVEEIVVYYRKRTSRFSFLSFILNGFRYLQAFFRGWSHYRKRHGLPLFIHVHVLNRCGLLARAINIRYKVPYVITEHWSRYLPESPGRLSRKDIMLSRLAVNGAHAISAVSQKLKSSMEGKGITHPRFHLLYNFVDTDLFTLPEQQPGHNIINFLHVSCFEQQSKNMQGILKVAERLWSEGYSFQLTMVGNTSHHERELRNMLNLNNRPVFFKGVLEKDQLVRAFHNAHYQVLFSNYETFGIVIYEGLAAGVPVIATKTADIPLHINKERGLLVEPGDGGELYKCMKYCIEHRPGYPKEKLREYVMKHFSRKAVSGQLKELYGEWVTGK